MNSSRLATDEKTKPRVRVLMIDDDEDDYVLVRDLLSGIPWTTFDLEWRASAHDGEEALAAQTYDVCLLDYCLGETTGLEVLQRLRTRKCDVPIILLTGMPDRTIDVMAMASGASDYLLKGAVDATTLERSIRYCLERNRVQAANRSLERRLEHLIDCSPCIIYSLDCTEARESWWGTVTYVSANVTSLLGLSPPEFTCPGSNFWWERVHPADRERVSTGTRHGENGFREYRFRHGDGSWRWIHDERRVIRDESGSPLDVIGCWIDVTEARRAETERVTRHSVELVLAESNSHAQAIPRVIEAVGLAMDCCWGALWERDPVSGFPVAAHTWGAPGLPPVFDGASRKRHRTAGLGLVERAWSTLRPQWATNLSSEIEASRAVAAEQAGLRTGLACPLLLGGECRAVLELYSGSDQGSSDELPEVLLFAVSQIAQFLGRRQLEEEFRQAQKMEALGQLAGGVAHDFNNLLTVIGGHADILRQLDPNAARSASLATISQAVESAATLTRQLLTFCRRRGVTIQAVDPNQILRQLRRMLSRILGEDISLNLELAPDPGTVRADPGQLEQAFMNLAVNARDAMPNGGTLTFRTGIVVAPADRIVRGARLPAGPYVSITVIDDGEGVDEAIASRVFEPFFTTKEHGKGTGLGLSTVCGIISKFGGTIDMASKPGQGTTFEILFPRESQPAARVELHPPDLATPGGTATVLLVEDDAAVRGVVTHFLESGGYTVLQANDGHAALRICNTVRTPIDLLLTDTVMPGLGGYEIARSATAVRPDLKVLFMSGYAGESLLRRGVDDSDVEFLPKPIRQSDLLEKVRSVLESRPSVANHDR